MMNFAPKSTEQYHSDADRIGASSESDFDVSTFSDVHAATRDMMLNEGLSTSEARIMTPRVDEQLHLMYEATGNYPGVIQENTIHGFSREYKERMLDENKDLLTKLHAENPDSGFKTLDGILTEVRAETRVVRESSARTMLHAEGVSSLGAFTGTMRAVLEDPFIIGSMVASALVTKGAGGTAVSRAFGIAKTEAAIGAISETMIQPSVYAWKKRIDSPYSVKEAAMNIMIAGGMGAVLGGGGSYIFDPSTLRKAAKLKDKAFKAGDKGAKHEAEILRKHADDLAVKPEHVDNKQHFDAMDKATSDIEEGMMPSVSKVVEEKTPVDADTVQLDGVSTRAVADIAMYAEKEGKTTLYHGSPHRFEEFKTAQIGTGEEAQAFGYGLYFAEDPNVAGSYQRNVPLSQARKQFSSELPEDANFEDVIDLLGSGTFTENQEAVIKALEADDWLGFDYPSQAVSAAYRHLDDYDPSPELRAAIGDAGNLYVVEISDKAKNTFLDWDKPLSEQPASVKDYLGDFLPEHWTLESSTGKDLYKYLSSSGLDAEDASNTLNKAGIKGIKYYDAGSRAKEGGTSNFVVFDESIIKVVKRNDELISHAQVEALERRVAQEKIDIDQRKGERRVDVGQRKRVADMSPEEMSDALLTSEKSVLRSERAFEEDTRLEFQSFFDIDDFKEMNTRMTYEGADKVIDEIGQVMKAEAGDMNIPYHIHGDEFITQSADEVALKAYSKRVQDKLNKTTVEFELPDGKILKTEGVGISYGVGKTKEAAEETLTASKEARKAAGIRKGTRGEPDELRGQAARRDEDKISDYAKLRADAEPRPKPVAPEQILPENIELELKKLDTHIEALKQTDLDVPIEQIVDADGNIQVVTKKVSELLDEIEVDEKSINDVIACYGGVS